MDDLVFTSKHIQNILHVQKQRVEYLAAKLRMIPGVEESDRSGRAHKYSFKNVLQFSLAHELNLLGLGMGEIRKVLDILDNPEHIEVFPFQHTERARERIENFYNRRRTKRVGNEFVPLEAEFFIVIQPGNPPVFIIDPKEFVKYLNMHSPIAIFLPSERVRGRVLHYCDQFAD